MFNWTNTTLPKLTDILNNNSRNILQVLTYSWVIFLGAWFFAAVIGIIAAALYIKTRNVITPVVFFAVCNLLLGAVMPTNFLYIVGLIIAFSLGFMLYQFYVSKEE